MSKNIILKDVSRKIIEKQKLLIECLNKENGHLKELVKLKTERIKELKEEANRSHDACHLLREIIREGKRVSTPSSTLFW